MSRDGSTPLAPLARLASQRRLWFWRIAASVVLVAVLGTVTILALLDTRLSLSNSIRWLLWFFLLSSLLFLLARAKWRTRRTYTPREAAHRLESEAGIGQQLRTALEVSEASTENDSHGFRARLLHETEAWLNGRDWRTLVPRKPGTRWMAATGALALIVMLAATIWSDFGLGLRRVLLPGTTTTYTRLTWIDPPRYFDQRHPPLLRLELDGRPATPTLHLREMGSDEWETFEFTSHENSSTWDAVLSGRQAGLIAYATAGDGKTAPLQLDFEPIPELREARVSLAFPDYLGREEETRNGGDVRAVEGTEVTWTFVFNTAPAKIEWTAGGTGDPELLASSETCVTSTHELRPGTINPTLTVTDRRGRPVDSWRFEAVGLVDELPTIEILEPAKDVDATSITELPVRIRAKDDHGLDEIGVVLEAAGETRWILEKVIDVTDLRLANEMVTAMLEEVPLDITDNVRLYAYALDRKPRGGPRALSHFRSIDIRQFKRRWRFGGVLPPSDGNGPKMEDVKGLEKIVDLQREIVSAIFVLKGGGRDSLSQELFEKCAGEAAREEALSLDVDALAENWEESGRIAQDDIVLLQVAGDQMTEAAAELRVPDRDDAFVIADSALANLLQLRKKLLTTIFRGKSENGEPMEPKEKMPELTKLADEARRLAGEEAEVRSQIENPALAEATDPELTRRQHDVALFDAGELYANLLTHPEKTEGALGLMDEAERFMTEAGEDLFAGDRQGAVPDLALAEQRLLELAEFLTILEIEMTSAALEELANQAEREAEKLEEESSDSESAESGGNSEEEKPESPPELAQHQAGEDEGRGESPESPADAGEQGEGKESKKEERESPSGEKSSGPSGSKSGQEKGALAEGGTGEAGEGEGESSEGNAGTESTSQSSEAKKSGNADLLAQAARRARLTDEILEALAERERNRGILETEEETGEGKGNSEEGDDAENRGDGDGETGEGSREGEREGAGRVPGEEEASESGGPGESRARALEELREQLALGTLAEALEETDGAAGGGAGGDEREEALKEMANRLAGAGGKMRELARELDATQLARLAEAQSELARLKEKLASEEANGGGGASPRNPFRDEEENDGGNGPPSPSDNPFAALNQEPEKRDGGSGNPFADLLDPGESDERTGGGNGSDRRDQASIGGPGGGRRNVDIGTGLGPDTRSFAERLDRLDDDTIRRWGGFLRETPFDRNALPILDAIEKRLDELVAEIPQVTAVAGGRRTVPEENRREIEDYFRDLSEDFGEETWIRP